MHVHVKYFLKMSFFTGPWRSCWRCHWWRSWRWRSWPCSSGYMFNLLLKNKQTSNFSLQDPDDPAGDVIGDDLDAEDVGLVAQVNCFHLLLKNKQTWNLSCVGSWRSCSGSWRSCPGRSGYMYPNYFWQKIKFWGDFWLCYQNYLIMPFFTGGPWNWGGKSSSVPGGGGTARSGSTTKHRECGCWQQEAQASDCVGAKAKD